MTWAIGQRVVSVIDDPNIVGVVERVETDGFVWVRLPIPGTDRTDVMDFDPLDLREAP